MAAVHDTAATAADLSVEKIVDKAVNDKVNAAVNRMQVYADGMEPDLQAELGLASHDDNDKLPAGAT
jgi:hypothetical protein